MLLVGNKLDLSGDSGTMSASLIDGSLPPSTSSSANSKSAAFPVGSVNSSSGMGLGTQNTATIAPEGREVSAEEASRWASSSNVPVAVEVSALSGDNVDEIFSRLARMILTKIELGEVDPDDPASGIQYGDSGAWGTANSDGGSVKSGMTLEDGGGRKRGKGRRNTSGWMSGMREWEEVFRLDGAGRRRKGGCSC